MACYWLHLTSIKEIWCTVLFFLHQMTPLHSTAKIGHIKVLGYLVEQGADINIQADNGVIICDSAVRVPD